MRAKLVNEIINESSQGSFFIKFKKNSKDLNKEYPEIEIFKTWTFGEIAGALGRVGNSEATNGKLDLNKFYNFLKARGFKADFHKMKDVLLQAAPYMGIEKQLKLSRDERSDMNMASMMLTGAAAIDQFQKAEIVAAEAIDSDHVVRSKCGETEPIYYRINGTLFNSRGELRTITQHEINMLKRAYVIDHGDPAKTVWKNYWDARPITLGSINRHSKDLYRTSDCLDD